MKKNVFLGLACAFALSGTMSIYAGEWKESEYGQWYLKDDGTYPVSCWEWLDKDSDGMAECYYFDQNGYLVINTVVEGREVNENGAWVQDGVVQKKEETASQQTDIDSDLFINLSEYFTTDEQYFYKAKDILVGENKQDGDWWYWDALEMKQNNSTPPNNLQYLKISRRTSPEIELYYDIDSEEHRITKIVGHPAAFVRGLDETKRYSIEEIQELAERCGAEDIQTDVTTRTEKGFTVINGTHPTITYKTTTITFTLNHLHYKYFIGDATSGNYTFYVTE